MNKKTFTTDNFKAGDFVWFCNIEFHPSGRIRFNIRPTKVKIKKVESDRIEIELNGYQYYRVPTTYFLSDSDINYGYNDLDKYIAKTKEESEKKYNELLRNAVEEKYNSFRRFEQSVLLRLL